MVAAASFVGIRERVARTFTIITGLEAQTLEWATANVRQLQQRQTIDGIYEWFVDPPARPPLSMSVDFGLVFYLLRSCFDYAAWQLVELSGGTPTRATAFPIISDPAKWLTAAQNSLSRIDARALDVILQMQPFQSATLEENALKFLEEVAQVERHRYLVATAALSDTLDFSPHGSASSPVMREWVVQSVDPAILELDETRPALITAEVTFDDGSRDRDIRWERTQHLHEVRPSIMFTARPSLDHGVPMVSLRPFAREMRAWLLVLEAEAARLEKENASHDTARSGQTKTKPRGPSLE